MMTPPTSALQTQHSLKIQAARAALAYVEPLLDSDAVIGVGTGSTTDAFIDALAPYQGRLRGTVASSERSAARLAALGLPVLDLNNLSHLPLYVDGADEIDAHFSLIKGGGGALTREKIVASVAEQFVCIADVSKRVAVLGAFALPVEVIPMARASVARALSVTKSVRQRGYPPSFANARATLALTDPIQMETCINDIPGVVTCGLFALRGADVLLLASPDGVQCLDAHLD